METTDIRYQVNDDHCMIVEFLSDGNSLSVAYQCWLRDDQLHDIANLKKAVLNKTITMISWPKSTIHPAKLMQKKMKKTEWGKDEAVRILNYGSKSVYLRHFY